MGTGILQDLVVVMVVAAAATIIFYRLRQPVVLGYLLAGLLVGPHFGRLVSDVASIDGLAHLGIIFLMFAVGLEFDLKKLRKVGLKATVAAAVQIGVMILVGFETGRWLGWSVYDSIFLGAIISISSTVIIVKILAEMGKLKEEYAELAFGILIIEDIAAIVMVAVLAALGETGSFDPGVLGGTLGAILLFVFIFLAVGLVMVPRLIESVSRFHVEEVLVITVVGLAFAAALLAENLGFSVALGAFLMGAIIAESKAVKRVEHKVVPIRDLFTAMFFVAVGMLINPADLVTYWWPIFLITMVTIVGKIVGVTLGAFLAGFDGRTAFKTGSVMAQIGEFSFIIAALGLSLGVIRPELYPIAIAVCAITSLTTPLFMRIGPAVADVLTPRFPAWYARGLAAYTRLVNKAGAQGQEALAPHDGRRSRHGTRVAIYAAWLFGLLIMAAYVSEWVGAEVETRLSLGDNAARASALAVLGLAGLPLFVAFVKATEAYAFSAAKSRAMNPKQLSKRESLLRRPHVVARLVASLASVVLVAIALRVAWGVHPLAIPDVWVAVPILMVVCFIGFFAWHRLERVYVGMERTLNSLLGHDDEEAFHDRNKHLKQRLPWGMDLEEVHLRPIDHAAYMSLKDLNLRDRTGATVLLVERGSQVVHNPHADMVLLPHDRLILVGKRDQLENAQRYLQHLAQRREPIVEEDVRIPAGSPFVGQTLGALDLSDTAARPEYVRKRDGTMVAPSPRVVVEPDDHIVFYGPEASIEKARERLRAGRPGERARPKLGPNKGM